MISLFFFLHGEIVGMGQAGTSAARPVTPIAVATLEPPLPTPTPTPQAFPSLNVVTHGLVRSSYVPSSSNNSALMFGIADNLPALSTSQLNADLAGMRALGVSWLRYDFNWNNISSGPGQYDWSNYDRVVAAVAAHGMHTLGILDYTPSWARSSACPDTQMCVPADPNAYGAFAAAAAGRYDSMGVHAWEIWNEPNNAQFFQPEADPSAYVPLLVAADGAIKQVDPGALVISGGLAPEYSEDGNVDPATFVSDMYADGAGGHFDILGDHPYSWPFLASWPNPDGAWDQMSVIHDIMASHGDGAKPIWITEYGAPTDGPGTQASSGESWSEGGDDHVSEELQAQIAAVAVAQARSYPWVGAFFWYNYQDDGTSSDTVENFFGLLRADGSLKPAYYALQSAIY